MNEQEKRELMLKAAVKFKDGWPHKDKMFLVKNIFDDELFTSNALPAISSYSIVCTRAEYETFVESLFEGAPEGATHYCIDLPLKYWDMSDSPKVFLDGKWYFSPQSTSMIKTLIPRPRKSEKLENLLSVMDAIGTWDVKGDTLEESVCDTFGKNAWQELCEIVRLGVKIKKEEFK